LIILIILGENYKLWSSSLCSFLQPPVTSSRFGPNILLNTLFLNTLFKVQNKTTKSEYIVITLSNIAVNSMNTSVTPSCYYSSFISDLLSHFQCVIEMISVSDMLIGSCGEPSYYPQYPTKCSR
jgi:hypothetical protein